MDFQDREKCLRKYDEHYAHVRRVVPKERLLEWQVTDGWAPLCKFLELEQPTSLYPRVNETEDFVKTWEGIRNAAILPSLVNILNFWSVAWAPLLMPWIWLLWI